VKKLNEIKLLKYIGQYKIHLMLFIKHSTPLGLQTLLHFCHGFHRWLFILKPFRLYQYIHYEHLKLLINRMCSIELQNVKGSDATGDDSSNAADQQKFLSDKT